MIFRYFDADDLVLTAGMRWGIFVIAAHVTAVCLSINIPAFELRAAIMQMYQYSAYSEEIQEHNWYDDEPFEHWRKVTGEYVKEIENLYLMTQLLDGAIAQ